MNQGIVVEKAMEETGLKEFRLHKLDVYANPSIKLYLPSSFDALVVFRQLQPRETF